LSDASPRAPDDGVWDRLRRRKVVQWSVAYVAAAWALLQGLEFLADLYDWPTAFLRVVTLVLAVGLPIVVTLAWYHGDRGEQRIGGTELSIVAVLFLLGGGVVWYYQRSADTTTTSTPAPAAEKPIPTDTSIAVLPFVNMSPDKEQEYFADGISEELLNLLAQVPELRVIARTSSFSFKGKDADIAEIARRLNVANVLEGSVRKSGDKLRITVQLVRASDSSHLWSERYDRPLDDIFRVQDEIAAAVVDELRIKLLGDVPKTRATDPQVYELFLRARAIGNQYTAAAFNESISLYQQVLARDPAYTESWVRLAGIYCDQVNENLRPSAEGMRLAREATVEALALNPQYAPAHARLGWISIYYDRDLQQAANHLTHALTLEPANTDVILIAAILARRLGRWNQAIALGEYVVSRDPVSEVALLHLGLAYTYAGRFDDALATYRTALALNPVGISNHALLSEALMAKGDAEAALAEGQQVTDIAWRLMLISVANYALGHAAKSDAALAELVKEYEQSHSLNIATALAFRGEADRAFRWLDRAAEQHDASLGSIIAHRMFDKLHDDPRWLAFLREHGMAPEQLAAIKFDVTVPK